MLSVRLHQIKLVLYWSEQNSTIQGLFGDIFQASNRQASIGMYTA
jgi:hypothetical protein